MHCFRISAGSRRQISVRSSDRADISKYGVEVIGFRWMHIARGEDRIELKKDDGSAWN